MEEKLAAYGFTRPSTEYDGVAVYETEEETLEIVYLRTTITNYIDERSASVDSEYYVRWEYSDRFNGTTTNRYVMNTKGLTAFLEEKFED